MLRYSRKRPRYQVIIPIASLIDIVFLLLIYFLLTTNFMVNEGINVKLPRASAAAPRTEEEITVYVDREGKVFLGQNEVALGALFRKIREMVGNGKDRLVVVRADRRAVLDKVVAVMDVAKAAGAARLCLATEKRL
ncbi:MAG: biopolymer transporter ExbD [Desulfatiglandaceae bacterium]